MISCNDYDYIEIACTYQLPLKLTLKSGEIIHCIATDTSVNEAREECVRVVIDSSKRLVVLDQIKTMEAEIENPHFKKVSFL